MAYFVDDFFAFIEGMGQSLVNLPDFVGKIILTLILLFAGYCIALFLGYVIKKLSDLVKLDSWIIDKTHLGKILGKFKFSDFFATVVKWLFFIIVLSEVAKIAYLEAFSSILLEFARWVPQLIIAIAIGLFGVGAIEYVVEKIKLTNAKSAGLLATVIKPVLLIVLFLIILEQIGLNLTIATSSFLIILGGLMLGLALAGGIGFGLALKDEAKSIIKNLKKNL